MTTTPNAVFRLGPRNPDVFIRTPFESLNLHSQMLGMCSGWFSASMSKTWWTGAEKVDDMIHYRYVLNIDKDGISTLLPEHQLGSQAPTGNTPQTEEAETICEALKSMFKCFYRQPIRLRTLDQCSMLVFLADQYDALGLVAESIRASFFEWPELDVRIKENPRDFLVLGNKLQSARVFKEAFIHTVGGFVSNRNETFNPWVRQGIVPEDVAGLVSLECYRLDQLVANAIKSFLVLGTEEKADSIGTRTNGTAYTIVGTRPSNRQATAILKGRLGRYITEFGAPGSEGALFRRIVNDPFLVTRGEIVKLDIPYLDDISQRIQSCINVLVLEIKKVSSVLTKNNLRIKEEMDYLTCAEFSEEDVPWIAM